METDFTSSLVQVLSLKSIIVFCFAMCAMGFGSSVGYWFCDFWYKKFSKGGSDV